MPPKPFEFELYRLNLVDEPDLFQDLRGSPLRSDNDIIRVIEVSTDVKYDFIRESGRRRYLWSLRNYREYSVYNESVIGVTLARSVIAQEGTTVTDTGIEEGISTSAPPLADTMELLFFMARHLVVVERAPTMMATHGWRRATEQILSRAASDLGFRSELTLEPRPYKNQIIEAFRSFSLLTRLRVYLRLPNPELNRYTEALYQDLLNSGVREYLQDMKNPNGLNQSEEARPFASAAMAQDGYKEKEVLMEGIREGRFERLVTGESAARGTIRELRDFVRGLRANAQARETERVLAAIANEIDRIAPPEGGVQ